VTRTRVSFLSKHRSKLHRDVIKAMEAAINAANPRHLVQRTVRLGHGSLRVGSVKLSLAGYRRILVVGAGKASGYMGEELERILGSRITGGVVIVPEYLRPFPKGSRIEYRPGSHPIPSQMNIRAVEEMLRLVGKPKSDDLVIVLLSGGASALMESPVHGLRLADEQKMTSLLLKSGASIQEVNIVRKHISRVKGGRMAGLLKGSRVLTMIVSDVIGNELDAIGSGPTVPDSSTYKEALNVIEKYNLWSRIPSRVRVVVKQGLKGMRPETPKKNDSVFRQVTNLVIGTNRDSAEAAAASLKRAGYSTMILSTGLIGEAKEVGRVLSSLIKGVRKNGIPLSPPAALVCGGETTVTVRGRGIGGRNQEAALAGAIEIAGSKGLVLGSIATDGVDGPTPAAGALVDGSTAVRGSRRGLNARKYLDDNNSYGYFSKLGGLLVTGPTGTNVNDIMIIAADARPEFLP
jgi:glycerate 2-kinase